jgi:hypothetical protein
MHFAHVRLRYNYLHKVMSPSVKTHRYLSLNNSYTPTASPKLEITQIHEKDWNLEFQKYILGLGII